VLCNGGENDLYCTKFKAALRILFLTAPKKLRGLINYFLKLGVVLLKNKSSTPLSGRRKHKIH
jgi:hypothetical protein